MSKDYNLQLHRSAKDGKYRWHFSVDGDIRATGTDPKNSMEEAFKDAQEILETSWKLDTASKLPGHKGEPHNG